ncbi:MAG: SIMPL domain-containing protein [Rickettsiales bacterium]|jgi:uncharacterized protein YggE|nr:SIMPL domain-containing protein [Rickettsiales bacterium]
MSTQKKSYLNLFVVFSLALVGVIIVRKLLSASPMEPAPARMISVTGQCEREVRNNKTEVKVQVENLDGVVDGAIKTAQKFLGGLSQMLEESPKKQVSSNVAIAYKAEDSKGETEEKNIEVPLSFAMPDFDSPDFEPAKFFDGITDDMPAYDDVVKTDVKSASSKEYLEREYKSCASEAFKDAAAKAKKLAEEQGLTLKDAVSVTQLPEESEPAGEATKIRVRLDVTFNAV